MTKQEFLTQLRRGLSGLPRDDIEERLTFYGEMIDDRIEDGLPEEEAVGQIGSIDEIVSQIIADTPLTKLVRQKIKPKKALGTWAIVLLILGSPIWLSLLIAVLCVALAIYAVMFTVIIVWWAIQVSLCACALGGIAAGIIFICGGNALTGIAVIGAGIALAGLSIFMFFGCRAVTNSMFFLAKGSVILIKNCFINKEEAE